MNTIQKIKFIGALNIWKEHNDDSTTVELPIIGETFTRKTLEAAIDAAYEEAAKLYREDEEHEA